jgi:hypothetical protein
MFPDSCFRRNDGHSAHTVIPVKAGIQALSPALIEMLQSPPLKFRYSCIFSGKNFDWMFSVTRTPSSHTNEFIAVKKAF